MATQPKRTLRPGLPSDNLLINQRVRACVRLQKQIKKTFQTRAVQKLFNYMLIPAKLETNYFCMEKNMSLKILKIQTQLQPTG